MTRWKLDMSGIRRKRLLQGALLGVGAPAGWMLLCRLTGLQLEDPSYERWLHVYMTVGTIVVFSVFGFIIGRHEQYNAELSLVDPLTRLYNPRHFHTCFRQELARSVRQQQSLALVIADIDFFKRVNDTYGHQIGDVVLVQIARQLTASARESDIVSRVGGEEFTVLLPGTSAEGAVALAERMRLAIQETPVHLEDGRSIKVTISFGVAVHEGNVAEPDRLYALADAALYRAKSEGRNRVVLADASDAQRLRAAQESDTEGV